MTIFKQAFALVLCLAMLLSALTVGASVYADDAKTVVEGIRWFPCEPGRENDEIWEAEYEADGCLCQRFDDEPETGFPNYLDTEYGEDGSLTITRNGSDDQGDWYWPRIRTLSIEVYPELDLKVADTLYFDFTAHGETQWNISLLINGVGIGLARVISEACGVQGVASSVADGTAGTYRGSINLQEAIASIAAENNDCGTNAKAFQNMGKTYVPQLAVYCVGAVGSSITINELFISTAEDTAGEKCDFLDMGLLYGDEYYELTRDTAAQTDATASVDDGGAAEPDTGDKLSQDETATTVSGVGILILAIAAAVLVALAVVVILVVILVKKNRS